MIGCSAIQNPWFRKSRINRRVMDKQTCSANKRVTFTVIVERVKIAFANCFICSVVKPCTRFLSDSLLVLFLPDMISYLADKNGEVVRAPRSVL